MEARGMNTADHAMVETMRKWMTATLRKLKNRGEVVTKKARKNMRRALA